MTIHRVRSDTQDSQRQHLYREAIFVAIVGNLLLAGIKAIFAWLSGSSAVFSDAANSLSDTLYSVLMGIGLTLAQQPADEGHPQGHERFEPFVSLFIAGAMGSAGGVALWRAVRGFLGEPAPLAAQQETTLVLIGAILVKIGMYFIVRHLGREAHSPAIQASARDNMADSVATLASLSGVWGARLVHPVLDPVAGALVALWIFRATWEIIHENVGYLTGRGASDAMTRQIVAAARKVPGVEDVHRVVAEYVGPRLRVDIHVNADGNMPLEQVHDLTEAVRANIEALPDVELTFVHVEPPHIRS